MPQYRQRDIVLIKFPYTDITKIKQRPALIISSDWYNSLRKDIIVLAITSNLSGHSGHRDVYFLTPKDSRICGLNNHSAIKLGKVMTLSKGFVIKTLGEIPVPQFRELIRAYMDVLGYPEFVK